MKSLFDYIRQQNIVTLYHNCDEKDLPNILKFGIQPSYASRQDNLTRHELEGKSNIIDSVVYLGNKMMCDGIGVYRKEKGISDNNGVTLKIEIPKDEYDKMKIVQNPECLGATDIDEYIKIRKKLNTKDTTKEIEQRWKVINPPYTITVKGVIPPYYIKDKDINK